MRATFAAFAIVAAGTVTARPTVEKRYTQQDIDVLNYALTLEHLEAKFYQEALMNYTQADFVNAGFADPFYSNLQSVAAEEAEHATFLEAAIVAAGAVAVAPCTYAFMSTDVKSFLMLDSIIEGVGVSAYLGAATDILSAEYLTVAAQIAPIEARHTANVRKELGMAGMPQPFDTPLDMDEVYTLVAPMIVSCPPSNPALPVKAFPSVALATTTIIKAGSTITLDTAATGAKYAAFLALTGPVFQSLTPVSGGYTTIVPAGFGGQTYVVLTSEDTAVSDETTLAGPAVVEVDEVLSS